MKNLLLNRIRIPFISLLLISMLIACDKGQDKETIVPVITENAMVVSAHPLASEVGTAILQKGGNAIDAAIAVHMALTVVYPEAGNIGGGGFFVIRDKNGQYETLDFREKAPLMADRDMYLDEEGDVIENKSTKGHLAVGVPGAVDGMVTAYDKYGSLPWEDLIAPSIKLAEEGFKLTTDEASKFNRASKNLMEFSSVEPVQFTGKTWEEGNLLVQKDLANTLRNIRDHKRDGFYKGEVAEALIAEMNRGNGIISQEDLDAYQSSWRAPLTGNYKNYKIITMGPPSSGGIIILQMLGILEDYEISNNDNEKFAEYLHLKTELERRVYADRAEYMADSDYYPVPLEQLLDKEYMKTRFHDFDPAQATPSEQIGAGKFIAESEETTHFSIVDPEGNAVACTTTLNGFMGSYVVVDGAGFILNNEMDDFSIKPGVPNMYGVLGGEANKIEPGKRMLSSMTPTILEKDGDLFMVVGTPGGSTIPTSVFQTIINVLEFNMGMQEAVSAGRFHSQWEPDRVFYERDQLGEELKKNLEEKGHEFSERGGIGRVDAILKLADGRYEGGADPRGMDRAAGF